jgi:octaprenyl-diphosphate synthase
VPGVIDPGSWTVLADAARDEGTPDAHARLAQVQRWLRDDLSEIERALDDIAGGCAAPCDAAARHLTGAGGKRVRPAAALLSARVVGAADAREQARNVALTAEVVHTATLLHDDVMDEGVTRRGRPTARMTHGNLVSVLAGDFLLVSALRAGSLLRHPLVFADLVDTLEALVRGEVLQVKGRRELVIDRAHHFEVMRGKTASLFGWCCRAGARVAGGDEAVAGALGEFGERIGIAFQLLDDVLDVAGDADSTGKVAWADLREGKACWPVIVAFERGAASRALVEAASHGDPLAAVRLADAVARCGAIEATRERAANETDLALAALDRAPANPARDILGALARALVGRDR